MFINLIMLCKKVSDIWQYITVRTAAGSMGARAVQIVQMSKMSKLSIQNQILLPSTSE